MPDRTSADRLPTAEEAEVLWFVVAEVDANELTAIVGADVSDLDDDDDGTRAEELTRAAVACQGDGWLVWHGMREYPEEGGWLPTDAGRAALAAYRATHGKGRG